VPDPILFGDCSCCGGTVCVTCPDHPPPSALHLVLSSASPFGCCADGVSIPLAYQPSTQTWECHASFTVCGVSVRVDASFGCGMQMSLQLTAPGGVIAFPFGTGTGGITSSDCASSTFVVEAFSGATWSGGALYFGNCVGSPCSATISP
jgi:hypothetical protein